MGFRLGPGTRADGYRLHVHDELGSTNTQALALGRAGETGPLWVVAHRQGAGRGRRGSAWVSPEGNLAATLLMPVRDVPPERIATLGFVAGLALVRALDDVLALPSAIRGEDRASTLFPSSRAKATRSSRLDDAGEGGAAGSPRSPRDDEGTDRRETAPSPFSLKWPNDVLADGGKIAGILLEAEGGGAVAVGFGVNVAAAPEGLPYPATALSALGVAADAPVLFETLSGRFAESARIWNKGRGFADVRERWLERAAGLGRPVSVRLAGATLSGRFDEIDEGGRLIILAPDGQRHTVTAGEVHFGEAATAA